MIIGHKKIVEYFDKVFSLNLLSHAYSFTGIKGIGKNLISKEIVKRFLCNSDEDIVKFESGNHPDFLNIVSKNSKIGINEINQLEDFTQLKSQLSEKKAIIIDDADFMSEIFQNKILKFVENPPKNYIIIFIVNNQSKLLETIRSRVININFNPLSNDEIFQIIDYKNIEKKQSMVNLSNGSIGNYILWLEQEDFVKDMQKLFSELYKILALLDVNYKIILDIITKWKEYTAYILDLIVIWSKDFLYLNERLSNKLKIINNLGYNEKNIELFANSISEEKISRLLWNIEELKKRLNNFQNDILVIEYALMSI